MQYETFDNLFDALADTLAESAGMKARFERMSALQNQIQSWGVTRKAAAARLSITRPRLNNLLRGKLNQFSLDALVAMSAAAGPVIDVRVGEGTAGGGK